jgi:cell division protein FtsB
MAISDATAAILVGLLSMAGNAIVGALSVKAANKLTDFRLSGLEKKLDENNKLKERTTVLETEMKQVKGILKIE